MKIRYPYAFDPRKRRISIGYRQGKTWHYLFRMVVAIATSLIILFTGFNLLLRNFVLDFPLPTLLYGFLIISIFTITGFPLSFYSSYMFDRKFKLIRYNISGWFKDFMKGSLIYYVITLLVILALYFTISNFSPWWIYAGILYILFSASLNYIYPLVIVPFMWKTEPYRDKKMKARILRLCRRMGAKNIKNVVVIKESEKSIRPNAVFMGIGNSKKIGLFDTLLNSFTKDEIETVVGHELGHYINKDIIRGMMLEAVLIFPMLLIVDYAVRAWAPFFGINGISDLASLPLIAFLWGVMGFISMPLLNAHSRHREAEADRFALDNIRKPYAQVSTEKRLADMHLSELKPHPLIEFWLFSHPSTIKRIEMAENWGKRK